MLEAIDVEDSRAIQEIVVVGVGGSGNNAVNRMKEQGIEGVQYIAMNTDKQALDLSIADEKLQLGEKSRGEHRQGGQGAGADPEKGRMAAEEKEEEIREMLHGKDMVFVTAGLGKGTGTGASPVIARIAKEEGCLTVAIVNTPFSFENKPTLERAAHGVEALKENVDSLIVIPNDNIFAAGDGKGGKVHMKNAMRLANDVLFQAVQGITDIIVKEGEMNCDFADITRVMKEGGLAHIGIGIGTGDEMALEAIRKAIESPLLDTSIESAKHILLNIVGSCTPDDVKTIFDYIRNIAGEDVEILYGYRDDEELDEDGQPVEPRCQVTLIATGIDEPLVRTSSRLQSPDTFRGNAMHTPGGMGQRGAMDYGRQGAQRARNGQLPQRPMAGQPYAQGQPYAANQPYMQGQTMQGEGVGYAQDGVIDLDPLPTDGRGMTSSLGTSNISLQAQGGTTGRIPTGLGSTGRMPTGPTGTGRLPQGTTSLGNTTRMGRHLDRDSGTTAIPSFIRKDKKD